MEQVFRERFRGGIGIGGVVLNGGATVRWGMLGNVNGQGLRVAAYLFIPLPPSLVRVLLTGFCGVSSWSRRIVRGPAGASPAEARGRGGLGTAGMWSLEDAIVGMRTCMSDCYSPWAESPRPMQIRLRSVAVEGA